MSSPWVHTRRSITRDGAEMLAPFRVLQFCTLCLKRTNSCQSSSPVGIFFDCAGTHRSNPRS